MKNLNRRQFLGQAATGLGSAVLLSQIPFGLDAAPNHLAFKQDIGFQVFPIRDILNKDFSGTLKMMSGLGYQVVEMCSPPGYVATGFGPLVNMKGDEMKKIINDAGLKCKSCHFTFGEMQEKLDDRIEWSKQLGLSHMICSSFWLPKTATIKDYQDAADKMNKIGEKVKKAGMQAGFHNHDMEFASLDGQLIYDAIMAKLDGDLVKMQFQTQVITLGYKAATYFNKYPGRFISSHMSDWTADKKEVPIGQGIIDWKEFYAASKTGGVQTFLVEMNLNTFKDSATFLHGMMG